MKHVIRNRLLFVIIAFALAALACNLPFGVLPEAPDLAAEAATLVDEVGPTLLAVATEQSDLVEQVVGTPVPNETTTGMISGKVGFPSEGSPPQRIYALEVNTDNWFSVDVGQNVLEYSIEVPPGIYHVFAYRTDSEGPGAAYSEFVTCGFLNTCESHAIIPVTVQAGDTLTDINPSDWYALPEQNEAPPKPDGPVQEGPADEGSITGALAYPSQYIPAQRIYVLEVNDATWEYVITELNQGSYAINVAPGTYYVFSYIIEDGGILTPGGAYTEFVTCGLQASCESHALIPVTVRPNENVSGVDVSDFYAPPEEIGIPPAPG